MVTKKRSSRKSASRRSADAISLLKADHKKVSGLFAQFEKARTSDKKQSLANEICRELKVHTTIEEEVFYPAAREVKGLSDLLDEAAVEHDSAKELIGQIEQGSPDDEKWDAKVTVLGEYIKHHVKEEESEIFPKARKGDLDIAALGEEMTTRKRSLLNGRLGGRSAQSEQPSA